MVRDFRITLEEIHDCYLLCNDLVLNFLLFACTMEAIYKIKLHIEEDKRLASPMLVLLIIIQEYKIRNCGINEREIEDIWIQFYSINEKQMIFLNTI